MGCGGSSPTEGPYPLQMLPNGCQISSLYVIKQLIGKGTYGKVYRCVSRKDNNEYALKVVQLTSKSKQQALKDIQSIKSEISVLKRLNHPNIIKYYHFQVSPSRNTVEIVLQLVTGGSLKEHVQKQGPLAENLASEFCKQIINGLYYLHQQKIIHRDLKCANIMLTKDGIVKITDFGTAKVVNIQANDDIARLSASLKGTPYYMAPEVLKRVGHTFSADIWSLGCTIIEMLSGKPPWTGISNKFEEIIGYISGGIHPPYPPKISTECQRFLQSCLDTIPSKRLTAQQLLKHDFIDRSKRRKSVNTPLKLTTTDPLIQSQQTYLNTKIQKAVSRPKKISMGNVANSGSKAKRKHSEQDQNLATIKHNEKPKYKSKRQNNQKMITELDSDVMDNSLERNLSKDSQSIVQNLYYIKKAQKQRRGETSSGFKASKTSATVRMTEQNIIGIGLEEYKMNRPSTDVYFQQLNIRSNTQFSRQHQQGDVIDTMIARAERNRYLQEQKKVRQHKDKEKQKWEQELKQGAAMLKKELSSRYMYANY